MPRVRPVDSSKSASVPSPSPSPSTTADLHSPFEPPMSLSPVSAHGGAERRTGSPSLPMPPLDARRCSAGDGATGESSPSARTSSGSLRDASGSGSSNPCRSLNPAFTLSPRQGSDVDTMEHSMAPPEIVLELDKPHPPERYVCDVLSTEARRVFVTQHCADLAKKMSTDRILDSLLPALLTIFELDDYAESFDNCDGCIARVLPDVIGQMDTKSVETVSYFMGLIMELCCSAESNVRADVTTALQQVCTMVDEPVLVELLLPLVLSMRLSFWVVPRAIAAGLLGALAVYPAVVQASGAPVTQWFNWFLESGSDAAVLVREAAVASLHQWVSVAKVHHVQLVLMPLPLVKEFITDDLSDTVRYLLVQEMVELATLVGPDATSKYLLGSYLMACRDPSWRVRFTAADKMGRFATKLADPAVLLPHLAQLAEDEEPEIRSAAARQLDAFAERLPGKIIESQCVPMALRLGEDCDAVVRSGAAQHYAPLILLESEAVVTSVCRRVVQLMQDEVFSVQISAIQSLESIVRVLGTLAPQRGDGGPTEGRSSPATAFTSTKVERRIATVINALVQHLFAMSDAGNWRLRDAAVHAMRFFCGILREDEFTPLTITIRTLLRDPVSEVRRQAIDSLEVVARHYGAEWAAQTTAELLHGEFSAENQKSYMWRVIAIHCLRVLLPVVSGLSIHDLRCQHMHTITVALLRQYAADTVANVRLALVKAMPRCSMWFAGGAPEQAAFNEATLALRADADAEVAGLAQAIPATGRWQGSDDALLIVRGRPFARAVAMHWR
ncbi:protein phosphatase 2 (formerly 2A), regulatory subunit A [Strigomonas culicis]|uniref:Protein phosphatase 2 (Formerly 2A), regulatory subunit A n=1 Tax=Strigomonas culicis TaxID=28005 RepID=S9VGM8_9TRYP|nr:protein phosphatase 2 (formerly 2A), regulatory subunit A [Strigomonas culicis]|eukprot:EPY22300.1 protein phosphatase 2 (formerly 2A), regulatory subunit A [Strigomonas culicis]